MKLLVFISAFLSLTVFSLESFEKSQGGVWDWDGKEEDLGSDDDSILEDDDDEIKQAWWSSETRKIKSLLVLNSDPFILNNLQLGSQEFQYKNTEYHLELSFSFLDNSNSLFDYIKATIKIIPKHPHRFQQVLENANIDDLRLLISNEYCLIRIAPDKDHFMLIFRKFDASSKGTINIFEYGLLGKLTEDKTAIDSLEILNPKISPRIFKSKTVSKRKITTKL